MLSNVNDTDVGSAVSGEVRTGDIYGVPGGLTYPEVLLLVLFCVVDISGFVDPDSTRDPEEQCLNIVYVYVCVRVWCNIISLCGCLTYNIMNTQPKTRMGTLKSHMLVLGLPVLS